MTSSTKPNPSHINKRDYLGPRYCTCSRHVRTLGCPWQCDRCLRRIDPDYDKELQ